MVSVTKEQIENLKQLQDIDVERMRIRSFLDGIPPKVEALGIDLEKKEQTISEKETMIAEIKKEYRLTESDVQDNQSRIRRNNEKLVSVKTNKEYQAILKENEELHRKNSALEDEMLQKLDILEKEESGVAAERSELEQMKTEVQEEIATLNKQGADEKAKLDQLLTSWKEIENNVDAEIIRRFNIARGQNNGSAITAVKNAVCQGCHMNIPPQKYNELQRCDSLELCPRCYRIIYWEE